MAVKRERPDKGAPGQLRTADGRAVHVKLPPELQPPGELHEETRKRPRPEEPQDTRASLIRNIPPFGPG
jgi:hypothetical protein